MKGQGIAILLGLFAGAACAKNIAVAQPGGMDSGPDAAPAVHDADRGPAMDPSDASAGLDAIATATPDVGAPADARTFPDASPPDAGACMTDFDCPADRRCEGSTCVVGKRIGAMCSDSTECPSAAHCDLTEHRCDQWCATDSSCPAGYRCSPDGYCIEACNMVPPTLGLTCLASPDCAPCGVCIDTNGTNRCRMLCRLDRDCPGGAVGACVDQGSYRICAP